MTERRKLELQLNQPTEIELLYDEPVVGKSQYGDYFLYAVKTKEAEFAFFAPEDIHSELQHLSKGEKAIVTKSASQKGSKLITKYSIEIPQSNKESKTINSSNTPAGEISLNDKYYEIMLNSYKDALRIQEEVGFVDMSSVVRLAITLFIQRSR